MSVKHSLEERPVVRVQRPAKATILFATFNPRRAKRALGSREFPWYVAYRLRDGWTDQAETWWDDQGHPRECPRKGIFWIRSS